MKKKLGSILMALAFCPQLLPVHSSIQAIAYSKIRSRVMSTSTIGGQVIHTIYGEIVLVIPTSMETILGLDPCGTLQLTDEEISEDLIARAIVGITTQILVPTGTVTGHTAQGKEHLESATNPNPSLFLAPLITCFLLVVLDDLARPPHLTL